MNITEFLIKVAARGCSGCPFKEVCLGIKDDKGDDQQKITLKEKSEMHLVFHKESGGIVKK